jgi:RNA polymerase sigma-70 factor (ECF subfamily)
MSGTKELIDRCVSYRHDVHNFVHRMTGDASIAEEITQETYLRAVGAIGGFEGRSELKTWLFAIAKHEVYRHTREKKKDLRKLIALREAENAAPRGEVSDRYEEELYIEQIKNGCLHSLLGCLPFSQRCAFTLNVLNGLSIEETAATLGKTENAARILISRAKATIKRFLCSHCEHIDGPSDCRCVNMLNFSMKHDLVKKIGASHQAETAKIELRKLKNEIELMRTLGGT